MMRTMVVVLVILSLLTTSPFCSSLTSHVQCNPGPEPSESCSNNIMEFIVEGYKGKLGKALEDVKTFLDNLPIEDLEFALPDHPMYRAITETAKLLNQYVEPIEQLPDGGYISSNPNIASIHSLSDEIHYAAQLSSLLSYMKIVILRYKCFYYCHIRPGTPLPSEVLEVLITPREMEQRVLQMQEKIPDDLELVFPIDSIMEYYKLPDTTCTQKGDEWNLISLPVPIKSKHSSWESYELHYMDSPDSLKVIMIAHDKISDQVVLFNDEESSSCLHSKLCRLPSRKSAILPYEHGRCIMDPIEKNQPVPPGCFSHSVSGNVSVSESSTIVFEAHVLN